MPFLSRITLPHFGHVKTLSGHVLHLQPAVAIVRDRLAVLVRQRLPIDDDGLGRPAALCIGPDEPDTPASLPPTVLNPLYGSEVPAHSGYHFTWLRPITNISAVRLRPAIAVPLVEQVDQVVDRRHLPVLPSSFLRAFVLPRSACRSSRPSHRGWSLRSPASTWRSGGRGRARDSGIAIGAPLFRACWACLCTAVMASSVLPVPISPTMNPLPTVLRSWTPAAITCCWQGNGSRSRSSKSGNGSRPGTCSGAKDVTAFLAEDRAEALEIPVHRADLVERLGLRLASAMAVTGRSSAVLDRVFNRVGVDHREVGRIMLCTQGETPRVW